MAQTLAYGSWPSPIHSSLLTQQSVRLGEPQLTANGCYWIESRPQEKGRCVLMYQSFNANADPQEVLPNNISVHSKAHEYGGASYLATEDALYFIDARNQRLYRWQDNHVAPLTPDGNFRYADFCLDTQHQRLIAVREDHRRKHSGDAKEETNSLVAIPLNASQTVQVLADGHDFFSNPRLSPDGQMISWICWDHPFMPWDSSSCLLADVGSTGELSNIRKVAGGLGESVFQPQWSPAGELFLVSDRNDWWNLYRVDSDSLASASGDMMLKAIAPMQAEFATPQWVFGMSTYGFFNDREILCCYTHQGQWSLSTIVLSDDDSPATLQLIDTPFCDISNIYCDDGKATFLASTHTTATQLFSFDGSDFQRLAESSRHDIELDYLSAPETMTFATGNHSGAEASAGDLMAHGFFYPPKNPVIKGPENEKPPLIVLCHGGPTGATETGLNFKIQYWTSRGFAVMDVNYRGSTGYGRHYREQLNGAWGIHDVEDVCAAVKHLANHHLIDPERVAIKGSSAGGYTVLAALTFSDTFKAGASLYGIGDLETLATDTHKFESRYLDTLVGPYPQEKSLYLARSPIHHSEQLNCPVIFFQGLDDKVVPPNQAQAMVDALDEKKVPVAYVPFDGEGHGFRQAASIQRCLEAEWSFYGQVFGFPVDDNIEPVAIKHLSGVVDGDIH